jgi:hypothetical protein
MNIGRLPARPPFRSSLSSRTASTCEAPPASIAHLLPLPLPNDAWPWRKAVVACLGVSPVRDSPQPDLAGLEWLSTHSPSKDRRAFNKRQGLALLDMRAFSLGAASVSRTEELVILDRFVKNLHCFLESEYCPASIALDLGTLTKLQHAGDNVFADMLKSGRVSSLNIAHCKPGKQQMRALCNAVGHSELSELDFSENECPGEGEAIASMLRNAPRLASLRIESCDLTSSDIHRIAMALHENQTLRTLFIGDNHWGAEGCSAMTSLLATTGSLIELNMDEAHIGDRESFDGFCNALACNKTLERLAFRDRHHVCDARAVLNGLSRNHGLRSVRLQGIQFSDPHWDALVALLTHTECRLTTLDLIWSTSSTKAIPSRVMEAIKANSRLRHFRIDKAFGSVRDRGGIAKVTRRNRNLHQRAGQAVHALWNRSGRVLPLPRDLVGPLGEAFRKTAEPSTMVAVATAAFGDNWWPRR